ncbi:MAG: helix-turn-helix domain-containing protein [Candidatus Micrarchaeaceae archaeon]
MVKMQRLYKFRAYPSKGQQAELNRQMFLSKQLYNLLLEKSQKHFKETGRAFTKYDMNKWITQLKRKNPEFNEVYSQVLQNNADRVSKAYKNFFTVVPQASRKTG